jgi:cytochrome c peroxidase
VFAIVERRAKLGGEIMMMTLRTKSLIVALVVATPVFCWPPGAAALQPIELLGKNIFFDEISIPGNKQACASCHDAAKGWILPNSAINSHTVVAPGAKPHALGNLKPPSNAYASFSPRFQSIGTNTWKGGNFWDGRAEGCGADPPTTGCPVGTGGVSETITPSDLPVDLRAAYGIYLGPTADQALNPFPNDVEQDIRVKNVCQRVKTAKYKALYALAFGEAIDCSPNPKDVPAYKTSFKRLAVALAAWQASTEVNSFSSKRDLALTSDADGKFPLDAFTPEENLGHDLFYGKTSALNPSGKDARCRFCHNGVPQGEPADSTGEGKHQLYTDFGYHHIGVPFNREIPGVAIGEKTGLAAHVTVAPGLFKTPTLRNVATGLIPKVFNKAYTHNGWFKSLESLVHFYNTRDTLQKCETLHIVNATAKEALDNNCWPIPEFPNPAGFVIGNLGLTFGPQPNGKVSDEAALVAYLKTLSDLRMPRRP